ncbi:MAG TPA: lysylphosphatidylglycerol synthase transmembrane domain-containing protein [Sorangium sp.]|uniref:lysylphosphatidylglycerol synthase transmembrane domain-containing protein n=1 Tax=Sorangium sp. So ce1153 TaxID=3133333 RepID=UPI002BC010CA|nr:lysylphosphatidylglycerol synthase transmembrane domain-containing protein [Sorangium sp.]
MRRTVVRALVRLVGPLLLAVVILRMKDRDAVLAALASASAGPLALAAALNLLNIHLKVVRWDALLRAQGIRYPLGRAWASFMTSLYVGMLTPGRVGDLLRIRYLRHDLGVPYAEGLASVVMDRLCDLYVLAAFVAVGIARYSAVIAGRLAWLTWGGIAITVLAPLVLLIPGFAERLMLALSRKLAKAPVGAEPGAASRFLVALRAHVGRGLLVTLPVTVATFIVNFLQGYLIARALGLSLSLFDVTCLLAIANLLGLLPISIAGVGVREFFFALVFPSLGFSAEHGVSFGLLVFAVIYLVVVALGFVSWQVAPPPSAPEAAPAGTAQP